VQEVTLVSRLDLSAAFDAVDHVMQEKNSNSMT